MNTFRPSFRSAITCFLVLSLLPLGGVEAFGQGRRGAARQVTKNGPKLNGISNQFMNKYGLATKLGTDVIRQKILTNHAVQASFPQMQTTLPRTKFANHLAASVNPATVNSNFKSYSVIQSKLLANPAVKSRCQNIWKLRQQANHHLHWNRRQWCRYYPVSCHWWYSYCGPVYYFDPTCTINYDWYDYYRCPIEMRPFVSAPDVVWLVGIQGVLIPDRGLGITAVKPGSPAALAGLTPGMIITAANGIAMWDESSMPQAIDRSGGVLNLEVLDSPTGTTSVVKLRMVPAHVVTYHG